MYAYTILTQSPLTLFDSLRGGYKVPLELQILRIFHLSLRHSHNTVGRPSRTCNVVERTLHWETDIYTLDSANLIPQRLATLHLPSHPKNKNLK